MSNPLSNLDFSELKLDLLTLKAIEELLNYTESLIDPATPEAIASLHDLKKQIFQLKNQKNKLGSQMIPAGQSDLRQAFHAHRKEAKKISGTCSYLLLFYAAECGLKSIYLRRNNLSKTDKIQNQALLSKDGHNLDRWIKELKISANQVGATPHFHLANGGSSLDIQKAHQVWRYGVKIKVEDEKKLVEWLENICNYIKENINR